MYTHGKLGSRCNDLGRWKDVDGKRKSIVGRSLRWNLRPGWVFLPLSLHFSCVVCNLYCRRVWLCHFPPHFISLLYWVSLSYITNDYHCYFNSSILCTSRLKGSKNYWKNCHGTVALQATKRTMLVPDWIHKCGTTQNKKKVTLAHHLNIERQENYKQNQLR